MDTSLRCRVAVVTSGSEGIGSAATKRDGAAVFIAGHRQAELDKAVAKTGGGVVAMQASVSKGFTAG